MKNGDSPDTIVITYGRCNAAMEMVQDLMAVVPPAEWHTQARQMMDRDLLADDEWWGALQRRRRRIAGRALKPSDLPSYATRMTAGHLLLAAHYGRDLMPTTDDPCTDGLTHDSGRVKVWDYQEARAVAWDRSGGFCEVEGLHHRDCPGDLASLQDQAVTHHIYPREVAKREGLRDDPLLDHPGNLLVVWNGLTSLGAGGCHRRIHTERGLARDLGHLARSLAHVAPGTH
mgnify:CR=1 FL=1